MSEAVASRLAKLIIFVMLIQISVLGYVLYSSYEGRRNACVRGKLDRRDNADFQLAQNTFLLKIIEAPSVPDDVKEVAQEAVETVNRTSASLNERAEINCTKVNLLP